MTRLLSSANCRRVPRNSSVFLLISLFALWLHPLRAEPALLWQIPRQQGNIYLLGAIHLLRPTDQPYPRPIQELFERASRLVIEADVEDAKSEAKTEQLTKLALNPYMDVLDQLDTVSAQRLRDYAEKNGIQPVEFFRPWFLNSLIIGLEVGKAGYSEDYGPDSYYLAAARKVQKPVVFLETVDFQFDLLAGAPLETQLRGLRSTLKNLEAIRVTTGRMADAWKIGAVDAFFDLVQADEASDPAEFRRLVIARNHDWVPRIEALLAEPGESLVIVGAAHFFGPEGLLSLLRQRGHTVELESDPTPGLVARFSSLQTKPNAQLELIAEVTTGRWYALERREGSSWITEQTFYASNSVQRLPSKSSATSGMFRLRTPPVP